MLGHRSLSFSCFVMNSVGVGGRRVGVTSVAGFHTGNTSGLRVKVCLTVDQKVRLLWLGGPAQSANSINQGSIHVSHESTVKSPLVSSRALLAASLIVVVGAATGGTVRAAEELQYDRTTVTYGDLNLDSAQGTRALYARLRNGAENVCSSFEGRDLLFKRLWRACFDQAVAAAVVQVNRPGLTILHNQTVDRSKRDR
jgi:UrcA family protein